MKEYIVTLSETQNYSVKVKAENETINIYTINIIKNKKADEIIDNSNNKNDNNDYIDKDSNMNDSKDESQVVEVPNTFKSVKFIMLLISALLIIIGTTVLYKKIKESKNVI